MDIRTASIHVGTAGYPFLLRQIFDPPETLYYKGVLPSEKCLLLAVVGSRKMTPYGKAAVAALIPKLARSGIAIVSGLAYGIDAEALSTALASGGTAYGIIGGGLDDATFYPRKNIKIARDLIAQGGAVISEHTDGTPPLPHHFALRNRIIAGMSHAVLVIEAAEGSGSLITADVALQENRDVFTIPNSIFEIGSKGTNHLIQNGAHVVTSSEDILSFFNIHPEKEQVETLAVHEQNICSLLDATPLHIDTIANRLNLTVKHVGAILSELEIKGLVKNIGGNTFIKA